MIARHFLVTGRVQGVGFRWFVVREASALGVAGWTRNLPDGRVEALAQGEPEAVEALAAALAKGPPHARVSHVAVDDVAVDPELTSFDVVP